MTRILLLALTLTALSGTLSGCVLALGAGAAIGADHIAEERGGNLF
ncbi:hypothetical protein AADZ90_019235 [Aestuariibius sp. 2305UL40-4]